MVTHCSDGKNSCPSGEILLEPYEHYVGKFQQALEVLRQIAPDVDSVNDLLTEEDELEFVKAFRQLARLKTIMSGFDELDLEELGISEQEFVDYQSKYLDLYQKVKHDNQVQKESILKDIDFEIELIQR